VFVLRMLTVKNSRNRHAARSPAPAMEGRKLRVGRAREYGYFAHEIIEMPEGLFNRCAFFRRARLYPLPHPPRLGAALSGSPCSSLQLGNPASLRRKAEFLLHPFLNLLVGCRLAHGGGYHGFS
jgi:hypothetical protein